LRFVLESRAAADVERDHAAGDLPGPADRRLARRLRGELPGARGQPPGRLRQHPPDRPEGEAGRRAGVLGQARPINLWAMASATGGALRPVAALSAQICSSLPGMVSMRWRTISWSPSPRYSVETLMMPPALIT